MVGTGAADADGVQSCNSAPRAKRGADMNKRATLTRSQIERAKVPPGIRQTTLWDAIVSGFGVRCLPGGSKTFVFRYRPSGGGRSVNPRLLKLGAFPSISLDDARAAARIHAGNVAKGEDPAQQRAEECRRNRAALSKLLVDGGPYELHLRERGLVNTKPALSSLRRGLKAHMAVDAAALSRNHIVTVINDLITIGKRGAPADLRRFSRTFLEWTVSQGLTKSNPMAGLRQPGLTRHQRLQDGEARRRALSDDPSRAGRRDCKQTSQMPALCAPHSQQSEMEFMTEWY
jgi:hypothetical protein